MGAFVGHRGSVVSRSSPEGGATMPKDKNADGTHQSISGSRQTAVGSHGPNAGPQLAERAADKYSVAVMGRSSVGKSAITLRYTSNRFVRDYDPTIEDLHLKHTTIAGASACVSILDTAGQEPLCALRRNWMRSQNGFLFVFSLIDKQTFDELGQFYDELMDLYNDDPPPSVLVANKADFPAQEWVVEKEKVQQLSASWRNCREVVYTSAKADENISDAFESLCLAIRERAEEQRLQRSRGSSEQREVSGRPKEATAQRPRAFSGSAEPSSPTHSSQDRGTCTDRCRLAGCTVL